MALILLSKGQMANDILDSIAGTNNDLPNTYAFGLKDNEDAELLNQEVMNVIKPLYDVEPIYLMFDQFGTMTGNIAINLTQYYPEMHVISGLNLSMVQSFVEQSQGQTINLEKLLADAKHGVNDVSYLLRVKEDIGDEVE